MFERLTDEARAVVLGSRTEAAALRHDVIGTEHLLLALLDATTGSAGRLLAEAGVDKARVYADIVRLEGPQPPLLDEADAAALHTIGIDLDTVLAGSKQRSGRSGGRHAAAAVGSAGAARRSPGSGRTTATSRGRTSRPGRRRSSDWRCGRLFGCSTGRSGRSTSCSG